MLLDEALALALWAARIVKESDFTIGQSPGEDLDLVDVAVERVLLAERDVALSDQ